MSLFRNTFLMAITTGFRLAAGFLAFVMVARHLGAADFGTLMYWMAIGTLAALIVNFGTGQYMLREIGADPEQSHRIVGRVGAAKIVLSIIVLVASAIGSLALGDTLTLYWLLMLMAIADTATEYFFCAYRGMGDFMTEAWFSSLSAIAHLVLLYLGILLSADIVGIALVFMISRTFTAVVAGILYRKNYGPFQLLAHWRGWWTTVKSNKTYAADAFLTNLYSQIDSILLKHLSGPESLGIYQAGMRLMQGLNNIAPVLSNVYLPRLSGEIQRQANHGNTARLLYLQLVGFGIFVSVAFSLFNTEIVGIVYGKAFSSLEPLLPWFGALLLLRLFASNFGVLLTASGQQGSRAASIAICLVIVIASGIWLVPAHAALGMIWSALLATAVLAVIYCWRTFTSRARHTMSKGQIALSATAFIVVAALLARSIALPVKQ